MKAIILAGGQGTRLWPLSRKNFPKQFLKVGGEASLLQETVRRLLRVVRPSDVVVLTSSDYRFHVLADLRADLGDAAANNVVLEPCGRNTAPALGLGALFCIEKLGCPREEVLFVAPADHVIRPAEKFAEYVRRAAEAAAAGAIVTFGIPPAGPSEAYGYVKVGEEVGTGVFRVQRFTEKPDAQRARSFLDEGGYYWNSGMFAFQAGVLLDELSALAPDIGALLALGYDGALARFAEMRNISIDYAVMERSSRVVCFPADLEWSDVGSWDAFFDVMQKDPHGNVTVGDVLSFETRDCLIMSDRRLIATLGVANLLVIETGDALLIAHRSDGQKVKSVVDELRSRKRNEADEQLTTHRPWGHYTILEEGERYKIKRVVVYPGEQLSLQKHHRRSEHWVVVRGVAGVTIGEVQKQVHVNESVYIPKDTAHRLANTGDEPLEIIEVQNGDYLGEDDIVRLEDRYGRR